MKEKETKIEIDHIETADRDDLQQPADNLEEKGI